MEILRYLVAFHPSSACVNIRDVGRLDGNTIPVARKARSNDATAVEGLWNDAKESLQERTR